MASNVQRGTRKIDAGDWIRLKRLAGAKNLNVTLASNRDITNPPPAPCCVSTDNNRMERAEFGTSRFRRTASVYIDYKAAQAADYVVEGPRDFGGGKILTSIRICNCATADPNKHNPLCLVCKNDKVEVRNNRPYMGALPAKLYVKRN